MKVILTKVLPATNTKPTRIAAKAEGVNTLIVPRDDSTANPHLYAAVMLVRRMGWAPIVLAGGGVGNDEYAFAMLKPAPHLNLAVTESARLGYGSYQILHHVDA